MTDWRTMDEAPDNREVLLWGRCQNTDTLLYTDPVRVVGQWEPSGEVWMATVTSYEVAVVDAEKWAELPPPPDAS